MFKAIYNFFHRHYHRRYHGRYVHAKKLFTFDLILLGAGLITLIAGLFFFFWKPGLTDWIDLNLSYGGGRVKSGEKVQLTLDYVNRSKVTLTNTILAINLPVGFVVDRTLTPTNNFSEQSTFNIGNIPPGGKGEKTIHGWMWTEPKTEERLIATLSYNQENYNRREQKFGSFLVNLPESIVKTELNFGAQSAFPAARLPIALALTNTENYKLENINVEYSWADKITWQDKLEKITLEPGEGKVLNGEIVMPNRAGLYTLKIQPQILINSRNIKLDLIKKDISIVYPDAAATINFDNAAAYTEPNATIPVTVSWKNNSQYELKNLRIKIKTTPGTVNLRETALQNNLKIDGDSLLLDASNRTLLADGAPQSNGETKINLILLSSFSLTDKEKAYLEITPSLEAGLKEVEGQTFSNIGSPIRLLLATNATLQAQARYFTTEGDQLGRGPIPPRVGETTKYWIFIQLQNTTNKLKDVSLSAELVPGVEFTGKQSVTIGTPLKAQNGKINWSIYQLPANSVTGWYFEVAATPISEQVGRSLTLTKNINVLATDEETGKKFDLKQDNITNILPANDLGKKQGIIVQN